MILKIIYLIFIILLTKKKESLNMYDLQIIKKLFYFILWRFILNKTKENNFYFYFYLFIY